MNYRDFGTTGIQVSELVLGGGAVGGILIHQDDETKRTAIRRAMEAGINWIDTAPAYGGGRSEEALGWLLKEIDDDPYITTKVEIDISDLKDIPGQIERSLEVSLKRLQRDSVTLLLLHTKISEEVQQSMCPLSSVLGRNGVLDGLQRMKDQGLTKHVGITALGETPALLKVIKSGRIEAAQVYYNMLNPSAGLTLPPSWPVHDFSGILNACHRRGVASMGIRIFSAGVIATDQRTGRENPLTQGDTVETEAVKAKAIFQKIGSDYGTKAQTALRFGLAQAKLSCIILGLAELEHLEEAVTAEKQGALPTEALEKIRLAYQDTDLRG